MSIIIKVTDPDGVMHELEALSGWRVMEVIRDHGLPIKAECGGCCCCGTCHVYVSENWQGKLYPPTDEEEAQLSEVLDYKPSSRLSCQLICSEELNGLEVILSDEASA
jgi:2Fe-2S ferredoxin